MDITKVLAEEFKINLWQVENTVALIDADQHRLIAMTQHLRNRLVGGGDAGGDITNKQHHVGTVDSQLRLLANLRQDNVARIGLDAAGIDQGK